MCIKKGIISPTLQPLTVAVRNGCSLNGFKRFLIYVQMLKQHQGDKILKKQLMMHRLKG